MDQLDLILDEVDRIFFPTIPEIDLLIENYDLSIDVTESIIKQSKFPRLNTGPNHIHIATVIDNISQIIDYDIFDSISKGIIEINADEYIIKKWQLSVIFMEGKNKLNLEDNKTFAFNNIFCKFNFMKSFHVDLLTVTKKHKLIIRNKLETSIGMYNKAVNKLRKYGLAYWKIPTINTKPTKFTGKIKNNLQAEVDNIEDDEKNREIKLVHYFLTGKNNNINQSIVSDIIRKSKFILKFLSSQFNDKIKLNIINICMDLFRLDFNEIIYPTNISIPTLSICSHKSTRSSHLCWASTMENLILFLDAHISNPEIWQLSLIKKIPTDMSKTEQIVKILEIKCPMRKTNHCSKNIINEHWASENIDKNSLSQTHCSKPIPLRKILNYIPLEKRKYYQKLLPKLYIDICKLYYPRLFFYCVNPKCEYANSGFIYSEYSHNFHINSDAHINCKKCDKMHYIHEHRISCIGCETTFCNTCKQTPYHEKELCLGPNIDAEKLIILKETGAKLCPNCSEAVIKADGCDHIKCACKTDWCFRCNRILNSNDVYNHTCISSEFLDGRISFAYH